MSTIFDLLYREYCLARLAEMRKQLLLSGSREPPEANCDADHADRAVDGGENSGRTRHEADPRRQI
jgi:hypothetical protein